MPWSRAGAGHGESRAALFLISLGDAARFGRAVQALWDVGNALHRVLDTALREDESRAKQGMSAAIRGQPRGGKTARAVPPKIAARSSSLVSANCSIGRRRALPYPSRVPDGG